MPSIITLTFNPALDKSTSIAELVPDKKLKCSPPVCEPGGGGINVARAITKLGGKALAIYLSGGDTGKKITRLLTDEMVETLAINIKESTRENLVIEDIANKKQYLFDMPGPVVSASEWRACLNKITQMADVAYIVVSGSLPRGVPLDVIAKIALIARKKNAKLIVDTSGEALKHALQAGVYLIKPNLKELALLVGKEELNIESAAGAAKEIIDNGNCEVVVVSMGSAGAMLVTKDTVLTIAPPKFQTKSTVGAGDSMVAGIVLSLVGHKNLIEAVQYGVACGTAATINAGTELCAKPDVEYIYQAIRDNAFCAAD